MELRFDSVKVKTIIKRLLNWRLLNDLFIAHLLNVFVHGRILDELLHQHSYVRVPGRKLHFLFRQLSERNLVARELVLLHHKSVGPQLDQPQQQPI